MVELAWCHWIFSMNTLFNRHLGRDFKRNLSLIYFMKKWWANLQFLDDCCWMLNHCVLRDRTMDGCVLNAFSVLCCCVQSARRAVLLRIHAKQWWRNELNSCGALLMSVFWDDGSTHWLTKNRPVGCLDGWLVRKWIGCGGEECAARLCLMSGAPPQTADWLNAAAAAVSRRWIRFRSKLFRWWLYGAAATMDGVERWWRRLGIERETDEWEEREQ